MAKAIYKYHRNVFFDYCEVLKGDPIILAAVERICGMLKVSLYGVAECVIESI